MEVQIQEFSYEATNVSELENQINNYLRHHDVADVQVQRWEDQLLVFFFIND